MVQIEKITKLLELTTSDNDHEALSAIRTANKLLKQQAIRWQDILQAHRNGGGRVSPEMEIVVETRTTSNGMPAGPPMANRDAWKDIFSYLRDVYLTPKEEGFLEGCYSYWQSRWYLTDKQRPWVYKLYRDKGGDEW